DRAGLWPPVAGEPLLEFPDHFVSVHRFLGQEKEQPEGHGSDFHASRCGGSHQLTPCRAKRIRAYTRRYAHSTPINGHADKLVGQINIHRYTTCVDTLPKEGFE